MKKPTINRLNKIQSVVSLRQSGFALVFEDIHDPHNAAAIMRTADAFGITDIRFVFSKEKSYDPKKIGKSSSSSANKWMDFQIYPDIQFCLASLKREGFFIYATALNHTRVSPFKTNLTQRNIAVLLGNEHHGLSDYAIENADATLTIPMNGMVESLNVSVSAAIIIAEVSRQRMCSKKNYYVSQRAKKKLVTDYLNR